MARHAAVGSRELKTRLGTYLQRVREGRTLVVTDHGEPVAELRPIGHQATPTATKLARLNARGSVTRQQRGPLAHFTPIRVAGPHVAASAISDDREDRF